MSSREAIVAIPPEAGAVRRPEGVSVVIPAYNYAHFISRAIESALSQDYPLKEVIVVDDGSTDNTREVVGRFGERVRYVYQQNSGLPAARNTGIREARYAFVGLLDADDVWLPGMLSRAMAAFERLPPDFAVVACQAVLVDPAGNPIEARQTRPDIAGEITV
ncbi:MAG: glycosyltransferase family A protein, partial [Verrucomicrobiota bacterium]